mmetsp:Transcript_44239/g.116969  ORF Transcript_44239/g.116969 Transcript_44239/m.116969 type:complete len:317 (+) Transcript_44239:248-1198(+)
MTSSGSASGLLPHVCPCNARKNGPMFWGSMKLIKPHPRFLYAPEAVLSTGNTKQLYWPSTRLSNISVHSARERSVGILRTITVVRRSCLELTASRSMRCDFSTALSRFSIFSSGAVTMRGKAFSKAWNRQALADVDVEVGGDGSETCAGSCSDPSPRSSGTWVGASASSCRPRRILYCSTCRQSPRSAYVFFSSTHTATQSVSFLHVCTAFWIGQSLLEPSSTVAHSWAMFTQSAISTGTGAVPRAASIFISCPSSGLRKKVTTAKPNCCTNNVSTARTSATGFNTALMSPTSQCGEIFSAKARGPFGGPGPPSPR